ncbi:hypothetical protein [Methanothrix sp.]|jgi:hypothetical protein
MVLCTCTGTFRFWERVLREEEPAVRTSNMTASSLGIRGQKL